MRRIGPTGVMVLALAPCGSDAVVRAPATGEPAPLVRKVDDFPLYE